LKNKGTTAALVCCILVLAILAPCPVIAEVSKVRVSAHAPIKEGDIAGAQKEALDTALEKGLEKVLEQLVPERTLAILTPLLEERILPKTEQFITNYQIVNQDVSDLAYTVSLSVTVDTDLLRKNLSRIGVIKAPGSPPLAAQFVTVDAPLGIEQVRALGNAAQKAVGSVLGQSSMVLIPAPDDQDLGFRVIRPPQTAESLASEGLGTLADLSIGVLFGKNGETVISGSTMKIPMTVYLQAVDVQNGALVSEDIRELDVVMGTKDGALLSKDTGKVIAEMAGKLSADLKERYTPGEKTRQPLELVFEGRYRSQSVRNVLGELGLGLGEGTSIIPERFTRESSVYTIWSDRGKDDIVRILSSAQSVKDSFTVLKNEKGVVLNGKNGRARPGVREFGEEVTFYRRLPVPGVENPDDIRKIEYVRWQEQEYNSDAANANAAPTGMGILGRIDPSRDHDLFLFRLPEGVTEISVTVEQSGPGEVQPFIRVFTGDGRLLGEQAAASRGRNIHFTMALEEGISDILLSVEDHLGRYSSMFPYVLTLGVKENGKPDEPS